MSGLTDLDINHRMAALSGYEIVEGPDPLVCYIETRVESAGNPRIMVYDVLASDEMTMQCVRANHLDVTWFGEEVTVSLPSRLRGRDFISYTHCGGDVSRAMCLLLLNAIGNDTP